MQLAESLGGILNRRALSVANLLNSIAPPPGYDRKAECRNFVTQSIELAFIFKDLDLNVENYALRKPADVNLGVLPTSIDNYFPLF